MTKIRVISDLGSLHQLLSINDINALLRFKNHHQTFLSLSHHSCFLPLAPFREKAQFILTAWNENDSRLHNTTFRTVSILKIKYSFRIQLELGSGGSYGNDRTAQSDI